MNYHELINEISRLRPFELGDDPYRHGQNDTIERILDLIHKLNEKMGNEVIQGCAHLDYYMNPFDRVYYREQMYKFCPKCGEEL